jgi:hypothetical protein
MATIYPFFSWTDSVLHQLIPFALHPQVVVLAERPAITVVLLCAPFGTLYIQLSMLASIHSETRMAVVLLRLCCGIQ